MTPGKANLFLIGINKAGTSWLYYLLGDHPSVFMAEAKELYHFGDLDATGIDDREEYHRQFPFGQSFRYYGDATVMYYRSEDVAEEIRQYNPEAKVLAVVRDPIERLQSQFRYHKQIGVLDEDTTLREALDGRDPRLLRDSHYEETLPAYADRFGSDGFMVVSLEEGRDEPQRLWDDLQAFLDVPRVPRPPTENRPENPTGSTGFRRLYRWTVPLIRRYLPDLYRWMLTSRVVRTTKLTLLDLLGTAERNDIPAVLQHRLRSEFAPTYAYLRDLGFTAYDAPEDD